MMMFIFIMYAIIFRHVRRQTNQTSLGNFNKSNIGRRKHKELSVLVKSAKKTFAIDLLYLVTFLPISIAILFVFSKPNDKDLDHVAKILFKRLSCFAFLNSCINPLYIHSKMYDFVECFDE